MKDLRGAVIDAILILIAAAIFTGVLAAVRVEAPSGLSVQRVRSPDAETGSDGYVFQQKTHDRPRLRLRVIVHPSYDSLRAAHGPTAPANLAGFARWDLIGRGCTMHVLDPAVSYRPEIIGHELAHCAYGHFHPGQDKPR